MTLYSAVRLLASYLPHSRHTTDENFKMADKNEDEKKQVKQTNENEKKTESAKKGETLLVVNGELPGSTVFYFRNFRFVMWPTSTSVWQTYICVQKGCEARIERYKEPSSNKFKIRLDNWPHTHKPDLRKLHDTFAENMKPMPTLPTAEKIELLNESFYVH
ncbi:Hypothetical predicted protein [Cloeon dipterum]|uniref:Uncharacterized protein n=1 Tax=Cloeon dipterum TaxID=197152 RepID=A0A8S1DW84_9INSE|nr:Hypothetical predicted protein [Cloeon dipterum]